MSYLKISKNAKKEKKIFKVTRFLQLRQKMKEIKIMELDL